MSQDRLCMILKRRAASPVGRLQNMPDTEGSPRARRRTNREDCHERKCLFCTRDKCSCGWAIYIHTTYMYVHTWYKRRLYVYIYEREINEHKKMDNNDDNVLCNRRRF